MVPVHLQSVLLTDESNGRYEQLPAEPANEWRVLGCDEFGYADVWQRH